MRSLPVKFVSRNTASLTTQGAKTTSSVYITCRSSGDDKSIYQREEEGKKPRVIYGQHYPEWRKPWIERTGEWKSKLAIFNEKNPSPEIMNALQKLPDLDFSSVKNWWISMKERQEIENQRYLPERVAALGSNLSALHFFTYRRAAVKLVGADHWVVGDIPELNLPQRYEEGYFVECIDCTNFLYNGIRYEGVQNLSGLNFLKWLSLKNQKLVDVWCLDRIAGQNGHSLEYLDISGCNLTPGCIFALARMSALQMLVITDPGDNIPMQAALSFLELEKQDLIIKSECIENVNTPEQNMELK